MQVSLWPGFSEELRNSALACAQWVLRPPELSKPVLNYCALLQLRICALWWYLQCVAVPFRLRARHGEASPVKCRSRSHIFPIPGGFLALLQLARSHSRSLYASYLYKNKNSACTMAARGLSTIW